MPGCKLKSAHNNKLDNFNSSEEICVAHGVRGRFIRSILPRYEVKSGRSGWVNLGSMDKLVLTRQEEEIREMKRNMITLIKMGDKDGQCRKRGRGLT